MRKPICPRAGSRDALAATSKHLPETPVELDPVSERAWKWLNDTGGLAWTTLRSCGA
jgi:hypothetical protein